jgi:DinB family protein
MSAYRERLLGLLGSDDPEKVLSGTGEKLEALLRTLGESGLGDRLAPGKWTARQIFGHLADVEQGIGFRVRQLATSEEGHVIQPFDQDRWAAPYPRLDPRDAVRAFSALRAWNLSYYRTLDSAAWAREGLHPERGPESVETTVRMLAGHDRNHLAQLEGIAERERRA